MIEEKTKEIELDNIDDQAEDFEEENEQEEKRNILFIGDSYQWGVRANTNFVDEIRNTYGDQFGKIYSICQGGYGFSKSEHNFIDLVRANEDCIDEKESITDIVITGGYNDYYNIDEVYIYME